MSLESQKAWSPWY